jgi:hypothetical protein
MTKKQTNSYSAWELLMISTGLEPGDTLLAQDDEGKESRYLWMGENDRYSIFAIGEDGMVHRFFSASLEDKYGHMIVGISDRPLAINNLVLENGGIK